MSPEQRREEALRYFLASWVQSNTYGGEMMGLERLRIRNDRARAVVRIGYRFGEPTVNHHQAWNVRLQERDGQWQVVDVNQWSRASARR